MLNGSCFARWQPAAESLSRSSLHPPARDRAVSSPHRLRLETARTLPAPGQRGNPRARFPLCHASSFRRSCCCYATPRPSSASSPSFTPSPDSLHGGSLRTRRASPGIQRDRRFCRITTGGERERVAPTVHRDPHPPKAFSPSAMAVPNSPSRDGLLPAPRPPLKKAGSRKAKRPAGLMTAGRCCC